MENNYKKIIECFCHKCGHNTKHRILFSITKHSEDNDDFWWSTEYCIAECCGCGSITFVTLSNDESNIDYNDDGTAEFVTKYKTCPYQSNYSAPLNRKCQKSALIISKLVLGLFPNSC